MLILNNSTKNSLIIIIEEMTNVHTHDNIEVNMVIIILIIIIDTENKVHNDVSYYEINCTALNIYPVFIKSG